MNDRKTITQVYGANLSEAWAHTIVKCVDTKGCVLAPVIVSFDVKEEDNSWRLETPEIRQTLDEQLLEFGIVSANQSNIETVAGTIFPETIWKRCGGDREMLFAIYDKMWPLVSKCKGAANVRGTYFRRLTAFGLQGINQLEQIIYFWNKGIHRHSALQAGIFDPAQDHREVRILGFPCLQQVVFHPMGPNGAEGMITVAFYANQLLIEKAYGNYLGLYRLGKFMACEMGMILRGVTCIASNLSLSYNHGKNECLPLAKKLKKELRDGN